MKSMNEIFLNILCSRERRAKRQKELIREFGTTLVSFTLNIPGPRKNSDLYKKVHQEGIQFFMKVMDHQKEKIQYMEEQNNSTSIEAFICIDLDAESVKKITIEIEEKHFLGRLFDFDVLDKKGQILNRDVKRKCFICDNEANFCRRNKIHTTEALLSNIEHLMKIYFTKRSIKK